MILHQLPDSFEVWQLFFLHKKRSCALISATAPFLFFLIFFSLLPKLSQVNYIKVTAFGAQADFANKYFRKGKRVVVSGELMTGSYKDEETGKNMRTAEVTANRLEFADGKDNGFAPAPDEDGFMNIPEDLNEELPFQ